MWKKLAVVLAIGVLAAGAIAGLVFSGPGSYRL